jgi:hypothetical protein
VDSSLCTEQAVNKLEASNAVVISFLIVRLLKLSLHHNRKANTDINANLVAAGPVANANRKVAAL